MLQLTNQSPEALTVQYCSTLYQANSDIVKQQDESRVLNIFRETRIHHLPLPWLLTYLCNSYPVGVGNN